mgnify:CR=1 FL=1
MQETDLFDRTFDPIWSKHWESSADWQKDDGMDGTGEQEISMLHGMEK